MYSTTAERVRHGRRASRGRIRQNCSGGLPEAIDEAGDVQTSRWLGARICYQGLQPRRSRRVVLRFKDECLVGSKQESPSSAKRNNQPLAALFVKPNDLGPFVLWYEC